MIRPLALAFLMAAVVGAPAAVAEPADLIPECSGQVAQAGECTPEPIEIVEDGDVIVFGNFPGANPNLPPGLTPANFPVVFPLGLTPRNLPSVLPLGLTPQNIPVG